MSNIPLGYFVQALLKSMQASNEMYVDIIVLVNQLQRWTQKTGVTFINNLLRFRLVSFEWTSATVMWLYHHGNVQVYEVSTSRHICTCRRGMDILEHFRTDVRMDGCKYTKVSSIQIQIQILILWREHEMNYMTIHIQMSISYGSSTVRASNFERQRFNPWLARDKHSKWKGQD